MGTAVVTVLVVTLVGFVFYGTLLDVGRGTGLPWVAVAEGGLLGVAVLAVWTACRGAKGAGLSLVVLIVLVVLGLNSPAAPLRGFAQSPLPWALSAALLVRLATATGISGPSTDRDRAE